MSHQFSFYLTPTDMRAAMERIRHCGPLVILHSNSKQPQPHIVPSMDTDDQEKPWCHYYFVNAEHLSMVRMEEVPAQKYWSVGDSSPAIQVLRSSFAARDPSYLRKGRLYYDQLYLNEKRAFMIKPQSFLDWAECVFKAMKRTLKYDRDYAGYVGPDAKAWLASGGHGFIL